MTAFATSVTIVGLLKLHFAEGRPYFLNGAIKPHSCKDLEFGYPSGHSAATSATYITLYYCVYRHYRFNKLLFAIGALGLVGLLKTVGASRIFLGAHSLDQVFAGFMIGTPLALGICDSIDSDFKEMTKRGISIAEALLSKWFLLFCICQILAFYTFLTMDDQISPEWEANIKNACRMKVETMGTLSPRQQTFGKVCYALAHVGAYVGLIVEQRLFPQHVVAEYRPDFIYKCIDFFLSGLPMVPLLAGSFIVPKKASFDIQIVFRYILPPIISNLYLFGAS